VGYLPATHDALLFIAKEEHLFPRDLEVELVDYNSSGDMLRELAAQRIDLEIPGIAAPVNFIAGKHTFTIVGGAAAESAAVVVPESEARGFLRQAASERIKAFRGMKVGTMRQSTGDALFRKALKDAGILQTVDIREYGDPNALMAELRNQFLNAAVLWSPHMSRAEAGDPKMKIVLWLGEVLPHHVCCRQVVHDAFLQTQRQAVVFYLVGIIRAMQFYTNPQNRKRTVDITQKFVKGTPREILEKELYLPDPDHHQQPRTTLSADLNERGIREYVSAMKDTLDLDKPKASLVLSKVDPTVLKEAYQYLGLSTVEALRCVGEGLAHCPFPQPK
jgi:NitT/TauT family transport system substrate-binding protein